MAKSSKKIPTFLSTVSFVSGSKGIEKVDPLTDARNKILAVVATQIELATEYVKNGKIATRTFVRKNKQPDGTILDVDVSYNPRTWFYLTDAGELVYNIRVGTKTMQFENGKSALLVSKNGDPADLVDQLTLLRSAINNKELDKLIMSTRAHKGNVK